MKIYYLLFMFVMILLSIGCSGSQGNPVSVPDQQAVTPAPQEELVPVTASDVLYSGDSRNAVAYKAFGVFQVRIDPVGLKAEIIPARNAAKIGDTFDADLTQFLRISPCIDCLKIAGINYLGDNQIEVGFAIRHPFTDIIKRPDLHVFDVRGIILAKGNYNFTQIGVFMDSTTSDPARVNVSLVVNADGYTHHFDELAQDTHYFNPPRDYDANINPFKRYFVNETAGVFNPHAPAGYNVMATGATWETQNYIFNIPPGGSPIDFAFIADCSYGQSATFQNRQNPFYFLPEFNRKEAWKVDVMISSNDLYAGNPASSAVIIVKASDWQASQTADPEYPDTGNLSGIRAASDVKSVDLLIPFITSVRVTTENVISGSGTGIDPYNFQLNVVNELSAVAGNYYGLVAVRDDLQGMMGPYGIPENANGFPLAGPEIYDYSVYKVFSIRVHGSAPTVDSIVNPGSVQEKDTVNLSATVSEPNGDNVAYLWEQTAPTSPQGQFVDPTVKDAQFIAPDLFDVPLSGIQFTLRLTASDIDGDSFKDVSFYILEDNRSPECDGIESDPYFGVINSASSIDLWITAHDIDGDVLSYDWDLDWDGDPGHFVAGTTGPSITGQTWSDQGFYNVACRVTENRVNPRSTICSRVIIREGCTDATFKIDDSSDANPGYFQPDTLFLGEINGRPISHVVYSDLDDDDIIYCSNVRDPLVFGDHQAITRGPSAGSTQYVGMAGSGKTIHVIWREYDSSVAPAVYRLKINSHTDYGETFDSYGGERIIKEYTTPDAIQDTAICALPGLERFALVCVLFNTSTSAWNAIILVSNDDGETWAAPGGGTGEFRDVTTVRIEDPHIASAALNGSLHVYWADNRSTPVQYYYDWSVDDGTTWNADMQVTDSTQADMSSMDVDYNGSAYFAWTDNSTKMAYFRKTTFGTPPVLLSRNTFFNLGVPNFNGIDVWVSPFAEILMVSNSFMTNSGDYQHRYFYSYNKGTNLNTYYSRSFGTTPVYDIDCDGIFYTGPDRVELFNAWIDNRTSLAPYNAHIWGDFVYVPERF